jgi:hypothetical protein
MYVGPGFIRATDVKLIRVNIGNAPFVICPDPKNPNCQPVGGNSTTLNTSYDSIILTVSLNLSAFANDFTSAAKALWVPSFFVNRRSADAGGKAVCSLARSLQCARLES